MGSVQLPALVAVTQAGLALHVLALYPGLKFKAWYTLLAHALIKQRARNYSRTTLCTAKPGGVSLSAKPNLLPKLVPGVLTLRIFVPGVLTKDRRVVTTNIT